MNDSFLTIMLQSLAALAAVLSLFAFIVWLIRRLQGRVFHSQDGQIKVIQRLALDTKHSLIEVACGRNHYLIGLSPNGITTIAQNIEEAKDEPVKPEDT